MANYLINNNENMNNINNMNNMNNLINNENFPIYNGPNCNYTIYELLEQVRISFDINRMKMYILTNIDWSIYSNANDQNNYINHYVDDLNNRVNQVNNMVFTNGDHYILQMIVNIIDSCNNYQKKLIYNMFSNL
jgi:hypothetical protein